MARRRRRARCGMHHCACRTLSPQYLPKARVRGGACAFASRNDRCPRCAAHSVNCRVQSLVWCWPSSPARSLSLRPLAGNDTSPQIRNLVERLRDSSHCCRRHRSVFRRLTCSDYRVPALARWDDCLGVARGQLSGLDPFSQLCGSDWYRREFRGKLFGRRCDWIRFAFRPLYVAPATASFGDAP